MTKPRFKVGDKVFFIGPSGKLTYAAIDQIITQTGRCKSQVIYLFLPATTFGESLQIEQEKVSGSMEGVFKRLYEEWLSFERLVNPDKKAPGIHWGRVFTPENS